MKKRMKIWISILGIELCCLGLFLTMGRVESSSSADAKEIDNISSLAVESGKKAKDLAKNSAGDTTKANVTSASESRKVTALNSRKIPSYVTDLFSEDIVGEWMVISPKKTEPAKKEEGNVQVTLVQNGEKHTFIHDDFSLADVGVSLRESNIIGGTCVQEDGNTYMAQTYGYLNDVTIYVQNKKEVLEELGVFHITDNCDIDLIRCAMHNQVFWVYYETSTGGNIGRVDLENERIEPVAKIQGLNAEFGEEEYDEKCEIEREKYSIDDDDEDDYRDEDDDYWDDDDDWDDDDWDDDYWDDDYWEEEDYEWGFKNGCIVCGGNFYFIYDKYMLKVDEDGKIAAKIMLPEQLYGQAKKLGGKCIIGTKLYYENIKKSEGISEICSYDLETGLVQVLLNLDLSDKDDCLEEISPVSIEGDYMLTENYKLPLSGGDIRARKDRKQENQ